MSSPHDTIGDLIKKKNFYRDAFIGSVLAMIVCFGALILLEKTVVTDLQNELNSTRAQLVEAQSPRAIQSSPYCSDSWIR